MAHQADRSPTGFRWTVETVKILAAGGLSAAVLFQLSVLRTLLSGLSVMAHECGHALTAWCFGYVAIPAVNLLHGGGVTLYAMRLPGFTALVVVGCLVACYRYRHVPLGGLLLIVAGVYGWLGLTSTHQGIMAAMGHGGEILTTLFLLGCAITGQCCMANYITRDRYLYALLGTFAWLSTGAFSWRLMTDADYQAHYLEGIGGILDNDLVVLSQTYGGSLWFLACGLFILNAIAPLGLWPLLQWPLSYRLIQRNHRDFGQG